MTSPSLYKFLYICLRLWGVRGNQNLSLSSPPRLSDLRYLCQYVFMNICDHIHVHVSLHVNDVNEMDRCYCVYTCEHVPSPVVSRSKLPYDPRSGRN